VSEVEDVTTQTTAYYAELQRGYRSLRFARPIEHQFRQEFALQHLLRMRLGFGAALLLYGVYTLLRLSAETGASGDWGLKLRLLTMGTMLLTLCASYIGRLRPALPAMTVASYATFAIGLTSIEVLARRYGIERHYEGLMLLSFHVYIFSGLLFRPALFAGGFIFLAYLIGGAYGGLAGKVWAYQLLFVVLTHVIGATALYAIERVERDSFLRRRLLLLIATRDTLTGLYNRAAFFGQFERTVRQAARESRAIGVVLLDIDHFKSYNDRYGHLEGDACLRAVANAIRDNFKRPVDAVGRYGGEEFIGVWHDVQPRALRELAEQLRASVQALKIAHSEAPSGRVTISVGAVACVPQEGESLQGLIQRADKALYEAKDKGRNRVVVQVLSSAQTTRPDGRRAPTLSAS
jgi:diguanylate cyclase (GGDEF)-like protein